MNAHRLNGVEARARRARARRPGRPSRFLVTGATGFLGSHTAAALLARGHSVCVVARDRQGLGAEERTRRVLGWCGVDTARSSVTVLAGDIAQERFGLAEVDWRSLAANIDEVVHCAASTRFSEGSRPDLERVNVVGTKNALSLAEAGQAYAFHLMSTAYAAGRVEGLVDETWREPGSFHNAYEETKHRAEAVARATAARSGMSLCIYRPSIVYGNSETGRSLLFNALYYPVRTLLSLRDLFLADLRRGGYRARDMGIEVLPDGLYLPVRVATEPGATLNLVPVDHFARAFTSLLDANPAGGTFHIITDEQIDVGTVVAFTCRRYGIRGLDVTFDEGFRDRPQSPLERLFEDYTAVYRPYMRDRRHFDDAQARPALAAAGLQCPRFTYESFDRLMGYAERVQWGRTLFD